MPREDFSHFQRPQRAGIKSPLPTCDRPELRIVPSSEEASIHLSKSPVDQPRSGGISVATGFSRWKDFQGPISAVGTTDVYRAYGTHTLHNSIRPAEAGGYRNAAATRLIDR